MSSKNIEYIEIGKGDWRGNQIKADYSTQDNEKLITDPTRFNLLGGSFLGKILANELGSFSSEELKIYNESIRGDNNSISPKMFSIGGYSNILCINREYYDEVIGRINDTYNLVDDSPIKDGSKLLFLKTSNFPRRKLDLLTSRRGKLKDLSTVRNVDKADRIIEDVTRVRKIVSSSYEKIDANSKSYGYKHFYLVVTSNNGRNYLVSLDMDTYRDIARKNITYIGGNFLKAGLPKTYNALLYCINYPVFLGEKTSKFHPLGTGSGEYGIIASLDRLVPIDSVLPQSQIKFDINSIELFEGCFKDNTTFLTSNHIDVINRRLTLTDTSKLYAGVGNQEMTYEEYKGINSALLDASHSYENKNVIAMTLESLTSYDIDKSILFLSLIFRNLFHKHRYASSVMNTSVSSLYELCDSITEFSKDDRYASNILQMIKRITDKGYECNVPLTLLVDEYKLQDVKVGIDEFIKNYNLASLFDTNISIEFKIKEDLSFNLIKDVDISKYEVKLLTSNKMKEVKELLRDSVKV